MKWATDWSCDTPESLCEPAPSLLSMLISMFMSPTADITTPLYGHECFTSCAAAAAKCAVAAVAAACPQTCGVEGLEPAAYVDTLRPEIAGVQFETKLCFSELQASIQMKLLVGAFISVPILLLAIPLIEIYQHSGGKSYSTLSDAEETGGGHGEHGEEFSAGDAFIHQGIHTIEFVLGGISNTASYLRLWALSLAHSQLAELFKDMVLGGGLKAESMPPILHGLALFVAYGMWSIMSLVVLLAMENLSSFLHALRLQWVEFQNKFYYGDGVKFTPFSFANIGKAAED
jgi:V-type H+-transporting ATPase subunit a